MTQRLEALAYGMLGSVHDAEDVVQEAKLKLHQQAGAPSSEEAFLYRVVSNLCIDRLRREKTRRKHYAGPWLPEPVAADRFRDVELAQELSMGLLMLLENLSPAERVVFVLREAFDFSFEEIAELLDISVASARQRASRARRRLKDVAVPVALPAPEEKRLLEKLALHVMQGDMDALVAMLGDDFVAYTDGGGVVSAAIRPVHGAERFATVLMHLYRKAMAEATEDAPLTFSFERCHGAWAAVIRQGDQVHSCTQIAASPLAPGRIQRVYIMRNPQKLGSLSSPARRD